MGVLSVSWKTSSNGIREKNEFARRDLLVNSVRGLLRFTCTKVTRNIDNGISVEEGKSGGGG